MKFIRYPQYSPLKTPTVITIGNFDGVHKGHQVLMRKVSQLASEKGLESVVVTMQPLASQYFAGKDNIALLTPFKCKYQLIRKLNIDIMCVLNFNKNLAAYSAKEFIRKIIIKGLNAKYIIVGDDFKFGKNRTGNLRMLKEYCQPLGIVISHIDTVSDNNLRVSSSQIRKALADNEFDIVKSNLYRTYSIAGKISKGQQLGRELGYPTININLYDQVLTIHGIFAVTVRFSDDTQYYGAASLGNRPTVRGKKNVLEVYIFDFNKQVYGQNVEVLFHHKIRNEVKFGSLSELKRHIQDDVRKIREYFDNQENGVLREQ